MVAQGLLHWLDGWLRDSESFAERGDATFPAPFGLLDGVARAHPVLRPAVLALVAAALAQPYSLHALALLEVRRRLLDRLVALALLGPPRPALAALAAALPPLDRSLAVHAVDALAAGLAAPLAPPAAADLVAILAGAGVAAAVAAQHPPGAPARAAVAALVCVRAVVARWVFVVFF